MSSSVGPTPETTLALIFGASRWPYAPKFEEALSFERSADALFSFLEEPSCLGLPVRNIKTFFNSRDDAAEQLEQAASFIERHRKETAGTDQCPRDLLVFYVGHGDFEGESREFYLSIRRTSEQRPLITSITARELGNLIRRSAGDLRCYLIIDCCFAAAVQHGFMTSPLGLAELKLHEVLPPASLGSNLIEDLPASGVALLAAAGLNKPAVAPAGHTFTAFTTALLDVFKCGHARLGPRLSLQDIHLLVERRISELFPDATRPEMRPLQQSRGRVELVAFFPNPAFVELRKRREAEEAARLAEEQRRADEAVRQTEEQRRAEEAARLAEEQRRADEAVRQTEEQRRAEEAARLAEEQRRADEAVRQTEEQRRAEEAARQAAEQRRAEEAARQAAEQRRAEEAARQAAEQRRAEEAARQAAEQRRAKEADRKYPQWFASDKLRKLPYLCFVGAALILVVLSFAFFWFNGPSVGLYARNDLSAGAALTDSKEFLHKGGGKSDKDVPTDFASQVKGFCMAGDIAKGHQLNWSDLKSCQ